MELERRTSLFPLSPSPESKRNAQTPTLIVACINAHPETVALQQEAIPDTAISESTNHIFLVKTQRESKVDSAYASVVAKVLHLMASAHLTQR